MAVGGLRRPEAAGFQAVTWTSASSVRNRTLLKESVKHRLSDSRPTFELCNRR